jgi:hypothetical protein
MHRIVINVLKIRASSWSMAKVMYMYLLKISTARILADNHFFLCQLNALNARLVEMKEVIGGY